MNDLAYRLALQEAIKRKFYGHDKLKSKHVPQYAISAERQYSQTFANLHREVEKEVQKYVPKIVRLIEQERSSQTRTDDFSDFASKIKQFMQQLLSSITGRIFTIHRINDLLKETGLLAEKTVNRQWFQSIKKTLGIDILEDYYNGAFYEQILGEWIRENLDLITTIPKELTSQLESTIMEGFLSGSRAEEIAKEIRRLFGKLLRYLQRLFRFLSGNLQKFLFFVLHLLFGMFQLHRKLFGRLQDKLPGQMRQFLHRRQSGGDHRPPWG